MIPVSNFEERIQSVVNRATSFYRQSEPGHFLVGTRIPVEVPEKRPLSHHNLDHQLTEWLDATLAQDLAILRAKAGLDDDTLPAVTPFFGIAEHSAWLGMDVLLQSDTCLPIALIQEPTDLKKLRLSTDDKWFNYMKSSYDYLRSQQDGTFLLAVRGTMAPMDIANAVRDNELFVDFLLQPEFVHELMAFLVKAIRWYYPQLCSWADQIEGGYIYRHGGMNWMPPGTIGHLANDAAMMCSAKVYGEFGLPYETQVVKGYDHVFFHVHNQKLHYLPQLVQLPGLSLLEVTNDPKTPSSAEDLARIFSATGSANLMLTMTSDQVRTHLDEMKSRNIFLQVDCQDRADAEDVIAFVRDRSKPL